jgi:pimeloyl-ACP methyl ester carboxylesterase
MRATLAQLLLAAAALGGEFNSDGVKIHYDVFGKGEPVILIHGLYASSKTNWELPGIAAELARRYRVIALDNRGHGQSGKPTAEGAYGTKMVGDIVRLMDHLHIAKAHVVGYSMGGMITMKLTTLHPDRVISAVLGGMGWLRADSPQERVWEMARGKDSAKTPVACLHGFAQLAVTEAEVKAIRVPVTAIIGERDICRRFYVEPLREIRSDWTVRVIAGAGHLNCVVKPDFKAQIAAAIDRHSGAKTK